MRLFSRATLFSGLSTICFDLSAAWIAVVFISPGLSGNTSESYIFSLLAGLPWSVVLFFVGLVFQDLAKKYEHK